MKNLANFIAKIDEHNFINIYFVCSMPTQTIVACESIMFHDKNEAQEHCDFMNKKYNTKLYHVFSTRMHI